MNVIPGSFGPSSLSPFLFVCFFSYLSCYTQENGDLSQQPTTTRRRGNNKKNSYLNKNVFKRTRKKGGVEGGREGR